MDQLLTFLLGVDLIVDRVGVEGSGFLGRPVVLALVAAGYDVREVQANRTAERRKRRRRAKTDVEDAEAIARETLADPNLPPAGKHSEPSSAWQTLTVLRDWRASPCPATGSTPHRSGGRTRQPPRHHPRRAALDQPGAAPTGRTR
uniref:IS110 family transposase n=1 Tax=Micromonospora acroterricola TaxID=2202421 RepID=UPI0038B2CB5C